MSVCLCFINTLDASIAFAKKHDLKDNHHKIFFFFNDVPRSEVADDREDTAERENLPTATIAGPEKKM